MGKQKTKIDNRLKSANGSKPNKKHNPHTKDGRARRMVRFHLDISRDDDYELQKQIVQWKEGSLFLPMLRKAFWLLISLMAGSIELLAEYFPGIIEAIRIDAIADMESRNMALQSIIDQQEAHIAQLENELSKRQPASVDFSDMMEAIAALDGKLDTIRQREPVPVQVEISDNERKPIGLKGLQPVAAAGNSGPKQLAVPQFAAPVDDDSDSENLLEVKTDTSAAMRSTQNFLKSVLSLNEDNPDKPKPDMKALSGRQRAQLEGTS